MIRKRFFEKIRSVNWVFPILLVSLVYILDIRYFSSPPIHSDDWGYLVKMIKGDLPIVNWSLTRPFGYALFWALTSVLGIKLQYFYLVNYLFIILSAILVYFIVRRAFPKYLGLTLPVALAYLIYPVIYTRTWLIMISYHFVFLIDLGVILLLMAFAKSGKVWKLLLALLLFLFSLGAYEGGLGIIVLTAILVAGLTRNISIKRRLAILSVLLVGGFFILWRTYIQHSLIKIEDSYYGKLDFSVITILYRYVEALFIFIFNWIGPLLGSLGRIKYLVTVIIGLILIGFFIAFLPRFIKLAKSSDSFRWVDRKKEMKSLVVIFLVGGLFWVAGYVPVIILMGPSFDGDASRSSLFAIAGASLSLVAGLSCLLTLVAKSIDRVPRMTLAAVIPFIVMGLFYQLWSQNERFKAWDEQRQFWNLLFEAIPDLKDSSQLIIAIPGYNQLSQFQELPFSIRWEANVALKVLYNDSTLGANYYYSDLPLEGTNMIDSGLDWSNTVFVYYDPTKSSLEIIKDPEDELSLPFQVVGYDPWKRIANQPLQSQSYRWLVK